MNILQKSYSPKFSESNKRFNAFIITLIILFAVCFCASLLLGATEISFSDALSGFLMGDKDRVSYRILVFIRLPRALAAILSGAALATAGVIIQAVLNNPMAAPNIIGVNSGAGLAAVITLSLFPAALSLLPVTAFFGAVAACLLIYIISSRSGADNITVTLVGIAVSSILNAAINMVKTLFPDSVYDTDMFLIGGLSGVHYKILLPAGILIILALILSLTLSRRLDIITLGDETAQNLGLNLKNNKFLLLCTASVLAGAAVSFAGLLGFVGLLVPHIARKFCGTNHKKLLPASMICGSVLVLLCDTLGRTVAAPYEISVGLLLSFIGGPFFITLTLLQRKKGFYDKD